MSPRSQLALVQRPTELDFGALAASDRRAHRRLAVSALAWLGQVRLKYGPQVSLIDLSVGGAQIETTSYRLEPGRTVVIEMTGDHGELSVPSRVIRCGVSGIVPEITYRGAIEFKQLIDLPKRASRAVPREVPSRVLHEQRVLPVAAHPPVFDRAPSDDSRGDLVGWHRLVARYRDGRMMKGFGRDFHPPKGEVYIWPAVDAPNEARIAVRLSHLKAVFFVHDFDGGPRLDRATAGIARGRRIIVTFIDGEILEGTTLNYAPDAPGFFVSPTDVTTNNHRIFVVNQAVHLVRFPR